jgi:hypothetical protein
MLRLFWVWFIFGVSCQTPLIYDRRSLSIQFFSLPNEKGGNWLRRREQLELADQQWQTNRPDLLILQGVLERQFSYTESDEKILSSGALRGFGWQKGLIQGYPDTEEEESLNIVVSLPVRLQEQVEIKIFQEDGFAGSFLLSYEDKPITVVSFREPLNHKDWYEKELVPFIERALLEQKNCTGRLILAGRILDETKGYGSILERFSLKDSSTGFCENPISCITHNDQIPNKSRSLKIALSRETRVSMAQRNLDTSKPIKLTPGGPLEEIWPGLEFGWLTTVRLHGCPRGAT